MTAYTAAGSIVAIGTIALDPLTDSYTDIAEITAVPNFGREYNLIQHKPLADRRTIKLKGSYDDGQNIELPLARDIENAGQLAARNALNNDNPFNIRITLNDDPADGTGSSPTVFYLPSLIMAFPTSLADVDSVVGGLIRLEVTRDIVEVERVHGT